MNAYRFRIPLTRPIHLKGERYTVREGVLLEREGQWAEASPLPHFSRETVEDVVGAIGRQEFQLPSLQFAIAALDEPFKPCCIPWNFLLWGDPKQVIESAQRCAKLNCVAAKLKVGRNDLQTDIDVVKQVRSILPHGTQLRLDANGAWSLEQATRFAEATSDLAIEYVEEPLQNADGLESLYAETGLRFALDETLAQTEQLERWPNAAALICKPTLLGGRSTVERLAAFGKPVIFSAAFESGIGVARLVQLAAQFSPKIAAGVDTLDWLKDDLLSLPPRKQERTLTFSGPLAPKHVMLERIEW